MSVARSFLTGALCRVGGTPVADPQPCTILIPPITCDMAIYRQLSRRRVVRGPVSGILFCLRSEPTTYLENCILEGHLASSSEDDCAAGRNDNVRRRAMNFVCLRKRRVKTAAE